MTNAISVIHGDDVHHFDAGGERITIGRTADNDVVVDHALVSRRHAELRHDEADGWMLRDVGSRNGTVSGGRPVESVRVDGRVMISLGGDEGPTLVLDSGTEGSTLDVGDPLQDTIDLVGALAGRHDLVSGRPIRIGRDPGNSISIDDLMVSRFHAELHMLDGGARELRDLGSHNGTYVNGTRIEKAVVNENDLISIGSHLFRATATDLEEYVDDGAIVFHASGIGVKRGGKKIVDDVSISLDERSFMAIVGPSGAGKSTLATALAGLRPANEGQVLYGGRDLHRNYGALRRRIGFVPQDDILHPELTVERALTYAAKLRFPPDVKRSERRDRVDEVLAELELTHRRRERIANLSGGQRKRVSVALELLTKPSLLILDEPTSGLDPGTERAVMHLLRDLADAGHTIMVVTHHVDSLSVCDRVLYLAPGGRQAYFGPPQLALAYFESEDQQQVFQRLGGEKTDWASRYLDHPDSDRFLGDQPEVAEMAEVAVGRRRRRRRIRQLSVLTARNARVMFSDWRTVMLVLLQGPALGGLLYLAMDPGSLDTDRLLRLSNAMVVLLLLVVGASWIGLSNSIREIVKERAIYRREAAVGLSPTSYLASKVLLISLITALQVAIMASVAILEQGGPEAGQIIDDGRVELVLVAVGAGLASAAIGLMFSALVRKSDQAVMLLPVLLVPLLVLAIPQINTSPGLEQARVVAPSNWAFQSAAVTSELNRLQVVNEVATDLDDPNVRQIGLAIVSDEFPESRVVIDDYIDREGDPRFQPTDENFWTGISGLGIVAGVALLLARLALSPRRRQG